MGRYYNRQKQQMAAPDARDRYYRILGLKLSLSVAKEIMKRTFISDTVNLHSKSCAFSSSDLGLKNIILNVGSPLI